MQYKFNVLIWSFILANSFFYLGNMEKSIAATSGGSPAGIVWSDNVNATQWAAGWLSGSGLVGKYKNECADDGVDNDGNDCFLYAYNVMGNRWFGASKLDTRWCRYTTGVTGWGVCNVSGIQYAINYSYNTIYGTTTCSDVQSWRKCIPSCIPNNICGPANTICKNEICDTGCDKVIGNKDCGPYCGDGVLNGVEQCDNGVNNGVVCMPVYGGHCSYCNDVCEIVSLAGGYCGDSVQNGSEQCDGDTPKENAHCDNCQNVCNDGFHKVNDICVCKDTPDCNQNDICAGESRKCCINGVQQDVVGKKDCRDMNWKEVSPN